MSGSKDIYSVNFTGFHACRREQTGDLHIIPTEAIIDSFDRFFASVG